MNCKSKKGAAMVESNKGSYIAGLLLILLGVGYITGFTIFGENIRNIQVLLGGIFLAGYFHKNSYGLLIPGCLLLGIAFSDPLSSMIHHSNLSTFGLGVGFIAIYLIDLIYNGKTHWWPLIPGVVLLLPKLISMRMLFTVGWGVGLIVLGLYIAFKPSKRKGEDHE